MQLPSSAKPHSAAPPAPTAGGRADAAAAAGGGPSTPDPSGAHALGPGGCGGPCWPGGGAAPGDAAKGDARASLPADATDTQWALPGARLAPPARGSAPLRAPHVLPPPTHAHRPAQRASLTPPRPSPAPSRARRRPRLRLRLRRTARLRGQRGRG